MDTTNQPDRTFLKRELQDTCELLVADDSGGISYRYCNGFDITPDGGLYMCRLMMLMTGRA